MKIPGPILLLDADNDDREILKDVLKELKIENPVHWFKKADDMFQFLLSNMEQPFIIFCDISLPGESGLDLKKRIDSNELLHKKSIPFVFYSTSTEQDVVNEAYTQMTVQGFFEKKDNYAEIKNTIKIIIDYWKLCRHPNGS